MLAKNHGVKLEVRGHTKIKEIKNRDKLRQAKIKNISVADPGCLSRIPDPTFFHPGSRIRTVSILDPGSSSKNLTPKKAKK
jgi:hypothetical protein